MLSQLQHRHLGMDIVRAFAILTVLIGHGLIFFPQFFRVEWLIYLAVFGVELFFALSGFLIGNILMRMTQKQLILSDILQFWIKRWMRTVPVYLFIVALIMLINHKFYFSYLIFTQNYFPDQLKDFPISWSLTIEEWFYLTFPLLMYLISKLLDKSKKSLIIPLATLVFLIVPLILRYLAIDSSDNWDNSIRKQIHFRPDGIAYGVLLAYLYENYKSIFIKSKFTLLLGGLVIIGFIGVWWLFNQNINIFSAHSSVFNNVVFYPLINIYSAVFVAYFIRFQTYSTSKVQKGILFISLISYSLYLVHFPIYLWFSKYATTPSLAFSYLIIAIIFMFTIGAVLYKTIEKPIINLRNSWTSKDVTTHL